MVNYLYKINITLSGITDFKAERGYLQKMMKRNSISSHNRHGDASTVSEITIEEWKTKLQVLIKVRIICFVQIKNYSLGL